jgi:transcriptional regulator with XRE-family HTH domain
MDFGTGLRVVRTARNMSQRQVYELTGIDPRYLSEMETGKILPSAEWDERIRQALGWTPAVDAALDALAVALGINHGAGDGRAAGAEAA